MSMNVYISASREVSFKRKDGSISTETQTDKFDAYQTPTDVTYDIVESDDPVQAYIKWVEDVCSHDEQMAVYADDDLFNEGEPVGFVVYNSGKEHIQSFREWINEVEEAGYVVTLEVI
jgi:hypothetical protein